MSRVAGLLRAASRRAGVRLPRRLFTALPLLMAMHGCDRPPSVVYILQAPQAVELATSASARRVKPDTPVVLHATRQTRGTWKQILSSDLAPDQCWMAAIPPTDEPEVADNVLWRVEPALGVTFNTDFRPGRTREVTMAAPGIYTFVASTGALCEPGRSVSAAAIQVTVEAP
jgi:hypothetical protein